jgi:hypothetical protein
MAKGYLGVHAGFASDEKAEKKQPCGVITDVNVKKASGQLAMLKCLKLCVSNEACKNELQRQFHERWDVQDVAVSDSTLTIYDSRKFHVKLDLVNSGACFHHEAGRMRAENKPGRPWVRSTFTVTHDWASDYSSCCGNLAKREGSCYGPPCCTDAEDRKNEDSESFPGESCVARECRRDLSCMYNSTGTGSYMCVYDETGTHCKTKEALEALRWQRHAGCGGAAWHEGVLNAVLSVIRLEYDMPSEVYRAYFASGSPCKRNWYGKSMCYEDDEECVKEKKTDGFVRSSCTKK